MKKERKYRKELPTHERLLKVVSYDEHTGVFIWKIKRKGSRIGDVAGTFNKQTGYITLFFDGELYYAQRLAWLYVTGRPPENDIDHKDMVKSHNWFSNLRPATQMLNNANTKKRKNSLSPHKGLRYHKRDRLWQARLQIHGKSLSLGYSKCPAAASFLYQIAADKHFGEFARIS